MWCLWNSTLKHRRSFNMESLLIASRDCNLIDGMKSGLSDSFQIKPITSMSDFKDDDARCDLVMIDQNFNEFNGIDFLMNIISKFQVPTVYMSTAEDTSAISEALNVGASNFLVKTENCLELMKLIIRDTRRRYSEACEMQDSIRKLKEEIAKMSKDGGVTANEPAKQVEVNVFTEVVARLKSGEVNLPVYPSIMKEVRDLLQKGASIQRLSGLLQKDAAITAKMVSVANSAFYRGIKPTKTLHEAINRIGIVDTKNYAELISNHAMYSVKIPRYEEFMKVLWEHSLATAYGCQEICKHVLKGNQSELFTIGLFHDIGKLLLVKILSELEVRKKCDSSQIEKEWRMIIENYHHKFGCSLIKRWKLPDEYGGIIMGLKEKDGFSPNSHELNIVNVANLIAKELGFSTTGEEVKVDFYSNPSAKYLQLQESDIESIKLSVEELMSTCASL